MSSEMVRAGGGEMVHQADHGEEKSLTAAMSSAAIEEVRAAFTMARSFPRDEDLARQKVIKVCRALGCPLKASGKSVDEDRPKEIKVALIPRDYPNVILYYYAPLPRGKKAKCRVVTVKPRPYKTLVCES